MFADNYAEGVEQRWLVRWTGTRKLINIHTLIVHSFEKKGSFTVDCIK